jgi:uncharacterized membrane protein YcgQ (UPF0703/DUF1980 family)
MDLFLSRVSGTLGSIFSDHVLAYCCLFLLLILALIRVHYFSYEDEYEIIHIKSASLFLGFFQTKSDRNSEFPKKNVRSVELSSTSIQKTLNIQLETQTGEVRNKSFNVSFVHSTKLEKIIERMEEVLQRNLNT